MKVRYFYSVAMVSCLMAPLLGCSDDYRNDPRVIACQEDITYGRFKNEIQWDKVTVVPWVSDQGLQNMKDGSPIWTVKMPSTRPNGEVIECSVYKNPDTGQYTTNIW